MSAPTRYVPSVAPLAIGSKFGMSVVLMALPLILTNAAPDAGTFTKRVAVRVLRDQVVLDDVLVLVKEGVIRRHSVQARCDVGRHDVCAGPDRRQRLGGVDDRLDIWARRPEVGEDLGPV